MTNPFSFGTDLDHDADPVIFVVEFLPVWDGAIIKSLQDQLPWRRFALSKVLVMCFVLYCSLFTICGDACPLLCVSAEACLTGWPNARGCRDGEVS